MKIGSIISAMAAIAGLHTGTIAFADETFPARPITFVVPYAPGGPADLIARIVADKMSNVAGQTIVVENRAGAGGNIAGDHVARSRKDGYTLLFGSSPVLVINPGLYQNMKFDPLKDFTPIAEFGSLPNAVLINKNLPVDKVADLVTYSRNNNATYASAGSGGTTHLSALLFARANNISLTHIPYKGSGPALQALLADQVTMTFTDVFTARPFIESGKLKILGVTSTTRSEMFPEVKTLQEQGMQGIDVNVFFALLAPAGISEFVKNKLSSIAQEVLADKDIQNKLKARGLILPIDNTPDNLANRMASETPMWKRIIQETNAKID
ncbi:MFS transporter [Advenella kashmirensis W13003]|uniref:MFS transporter n=1 Tax=Advenella kashmirensis W13003 TaxID=1424334 RepID=V8QYQ7_9BURK|nr:tripartite tricarboxylate transporter substrate binding protein [Advenella kashmirensis]ETF04465.1 MFS transporter [Advenella kashmirensis W13003]